jgi:outer membrane protein, multidrug efflux system
MCRTGVSIFVGSLILMLVGCASVAPKTDTSLPFVVPLVWSSDATMATGSPQRVDWWSRFNDPLLSSLITQALEANTNVKNARAALLQARALRDVSAAALLPGLNASASAQRGTAGRESTGNNFQLGLDASWEIDIFGANRYALAASEATALSSAASLGDVQVSIAAEVALGYITLRGTQTRIMTTAANLASQRETLQITQWRLQAGLVTSVEAEQARAAVEQTSSQLPALQTSIALSFHSLSVLTGQPPAALSSALSSAVPIPQATDDFTLSIPAETLRQRADVRAAEYQVTAALARVAAADAARASNFKLSGSLGVGATTLNALTRLAAVVSSLLASVAMPLLDGGAGRAQVRAQQAAMEQARAAYEAAVLNALKEVEDALSTLRGDRERLLRLQQAADAASNAAQLARQRYSSGLVDFQVVLETQRTQLSSQDSVTSATSDLAADHVRLYKALGGGWTSNLDNSISGQKTGPNETRNSIL